MCTEFATSWRQSRRVWTNLPPAKSSCVVSAAWMHLSTVVTQFIILCYWAIEVGDKWRHNDVIVEKVINIEQNSRSQTAMAKLSTESVGSRRELVANSVHTADATQLDSWVASVVCSGHNVIVVTYIQCICEPYSGTQYCCCIQLCFNRQTGQFFWTYFMLARAWKWTLTTGPTNRLHEYANGYLVNCSTDYVLITYISKLIVLVNWLHILKPA